VIKPTSCSETEYQNLSKMLDGANKQYSQLKEKSHNEWKVHSKSGSYKGTWDEFAQERFIGSPQVLEIQNVQQKYIQAIQACNVISYQQESKATPGYLENKPPDQPKDAKNKADYKKPEKAKIKKSST
jgi:hypothetical protein